MPKTVLLDEWHVTFRIPAVMTHSNVRAIRRVLNGKAFTAALWRAIGAVIRVRPKLKAVSVKLRT